MDAKQLTGIGLFSAAAVALAAQQAARTRLKNRHPVRFAALDRPDFMGSSLSAKYQRFHAFLLWGHMAVPDPVLNILCATSSASGLVFLVLTAVLWFYF